MIAEALDAIADGLGMTSGQLALAWIMSRGVVPIVGATRPDQLKENLTAVDVALDADTLAALDAASAFDAGHPYNMLDWDMSMALGYGGMFDHIDIPHFPNQR
ncbi:MAG: aldo/keto reductase [Sphingopyxis sp.]|uniref:aldo/keto reductase n=1 Tax=Sphingopyxis sp. TaxID=1908224 RepID=UPI003D6CA45D